MRDPKRIERILYKVGVLWERNPDWRLGQLIDNAAAQAWGQRGGVFTIEDGLMEQCLDELLAGSVKL